MRARRRTTRWARTARVASDPIDDLRGLLSALPRRQTAAGPAPRARPQITERVGPGTLTAVGLWVSSIVGSSRGVPDISMSAACNGAVDTYQSFGGQTPGWYPVCGTSEATPLFAGIGGAGRPRSPATRLGLDRPLACTRCRPPAPVASSTSPRAATRCRSPRTTTCTRSTASAPSPGYDLASGVGTVNAASFVPQLAYLGQALRQRSAAGCPTGRCSGRPGGSRRAAARARTTAETACLPFAPRRRHHRRIPGSSPTAVMSSSVTARAAGVGREEQGRGRQRISEVLPAQGAERADGQRASGAAAGASRPCRRGSGAPMLLVASITHLARQGRAVRARPGSATALPGTASATTSAPVSASPNGEQRQRRPDPAPARSVSRTPRHGGRPPFRAQRAADLSCPDHCDSHAAFPQPVTAPISAHPGRVDAAGGRRAE